MQAIRKGSKSVYVHILTLKMTIYSNHQLVLFEKIMGLVDGFKAHLSNLSDMTDFVNKVCMLLFPYSLK